MTGEDTVQFNMRIDARTRLHGVFCKYIAMVKRLCWIEAVE